VVLPARAEPCGQGRPRIVFRAPTRYRAATGVVAAKGDASRGATTGALAPAGV